MTDKKVYPVTADLEDRLNAILVEADGESTLIPNTNPEYSRLRLLRVAVEYLGEYEHGSVDVEDISPRMAHLRNRQVQLEIVSAVLEDFIGTLVYEDKFRRREE